MQVCDDDDDDDDDADAYDDVHHTLAVHGSQVYTRFSPAVIADALQVIGFGVGVWGLGFGVWVWGLGLRFWVLRLGFVVPLMRGMQRWDVELGGGASAARASLWERREGGGEFDCCESRRTHVTNHASRITFTCHKSRVTHHLGAFIQCVECLE